MARTIAARNAVEQSLMVGRTPKQARSQAKVERILAATGELLAGSGARAFKMSHVRKAAGVSTGTLYDFFPTEEALVEGYVAALCAELDELLAASASAPPQTVGQLAEWIADTMVAFYARHPSLGTLHDVKPSIAADMEHRLTDRFGVEIDRRLATVLPNLEAGDRARFAWLAIRAGDALLSATDTEPDGFDRRVEMIRLFEGYLRHRGS